MPLPNGPMTNQEFQLFLALARRQSQALNMPPGGLVQTAEAYQPAPQDHSSLPMQTTFGEIIAWRAWKFSNGKLVSPYTKNVWEPQKAFEANANPWTTNAGIFAHKRPEHVLEQENDWTVVGTALLWGDVVEHEDGYRAEFAIPFEFHFFAEGITPGFQKWLVEEFTSAP